MALSGCTKDCDRIMKDGKALWKWLQKRDCRRSKKKKGHDKKIKAYKKAAVPPLKEDKASPRAR